MRRIALAVLCPVLVSACNLSTGPQDPAGINVGTPESVATCTPVTRLTSTTGLAGPALREETLRAARNRVAQDALAAGADTLLFEVGAPGDTDALFVEAVGYRCLG